MKYQITKHTQAQFMVNISEHWFYQLFTRYNRNDLPKASHAPNSCHVTQHCRRCGRMVYVANGVFLVGELGL